MSTPRSNSPGMADQRTPAEQAGMSEANRARFPNLTNLQLNRRIAIWSSALVVLIMVIVAMVIRT